MTKSLFVCPGNDFLYRSLKRFLHFTSGIQLGLFPEQYEAHGDYHYFLTCNSNESLVATCQLLYNRHTPTANLIILGYDSDNCDVDLRNIHALASLFNNKIYFNFLNNHLNYPFFKEQISLFLRGHGEKSLIEVLNYSCYYLNNYNSLFLMDEYDKEELKLHYLLPGIESWKSFTQRFEKHKPMLYIAGWNELITAIDEVLFKIDLAVKTIENSIEFAIFEKEPLNNINWVHKKFIEISSQFNEKSTETYHFGSR